MITETTLQHLINATNQIQTTDRQHVANQVQFVNGFQVLKTGNELVFQGETTHGYTARLKLAATVHEVPTNQTVIVQVQGGESINMEPISTNVDVLVSCTCEDFIYRFATTDKAQQVLFGDIARTPVPKTDRPTQNIGKIGICKHLIKFTTLLKSERILK